MRAYNICKLPLTYILGGIFVKYTYKTWFNIAYKWKIYIYNTHTRQCTRGRCPSLKNRDGWWLCKNHNTHIHAHSHTLSIKDPTPTVPSSKPPIQESFPTHPTHAHTHDHIVTTQTRTQMYAYTHTTHTTEAIKAALLQTLLRNHTTHCHIHTHSHTHLKYWFY